MELLKGDWIGHNTIFYNEKTHQYGPDINQVIDYNNIEIDDEGLAAYLDYGYSVFGRTPVKHVKYLLPFQTLSMVQNRLQVKDGEDTAPNQLGFASNEKDVLDKMESEVNNWASSFQEDILIPTSGGFDSRLLNVLVQDKKRIHAYTYGTSTSQNDSREVVYAKALCERLAIQWGRIDLENFNAHTDEWYKLFGPAIGASGTYHLEFFRRIQAVEKDKLALLSGIIGDAWAGAVNVPAINDVHDYKTLGHTHGMNAASKLATGVDYTSLIEPIYEKQKDALKDPSFRIITAMRTKMMLLKFLTVIPESYGIKTYSPFLDQEIAIAMLNLPQERRKNRAWQRDFFRKHDLLFEEEKHAYTYQNSLNYYAIKKYGLNPLNSEILRENFNPEYIAWINRKISDLSMTERSYQALMHTPKVKGLMKLLGFKNDMMAAYFAYITIKPIEQLLSIRNGKRP